MKKQTLYFLLILLAAILLSGITTYFYLDGQNYRQSDHSVLTQAQAATARNILDNIPSTDVKQVYNQLLSEINSLDTYIDVLEYEQKETFDWNMYRTYPPDTRETIKTRYSYSLDQALAQSQVLDYCANRLRYVVTRDDYITFVQSQSDSMYNASIFSDENRNNIKKTGRDFSLQKDISVSPNVTIGVSMLFLNPFGNIIAISASVICAILLSVWLTKGSDVLHISSGKQYIFLFVAGLLGIFLAEIMAADITWELGDLSISVQSMEEFKTCRYPLSIGGLLLVRLLGKCMGCLIIFLLSTALFCMHRGAYIWLGIVTAIFILQKTLLTGTPWDLKGIFQAEKPVGIYHNSYFFDTPIASETILALAVILVLLFSIGIAAKQINKMILLCKERVEKEYFAEINHRYSEIRMLRHDMNNHLSAMSLLLTEGKVQDAQRYLQAIKTDMAEASLPAKTGVNALDLVLWNKISAAKEYLIQIQPDIRHSLAGLTISDYELCSIFGNLLDNAVEAVQKLPESQRNIQLSVAKQQDMLCIYCQNPYATIKKENGSFTTLKADKTNHGLGIRQIKRIAAKYHGTVDIKTENQMFVISVLLTASTPK